MAKLALSDSQKILNLIKNSEKNEIREEYLIQQGFSINSINYLLDLGFIEIYKSGCICYNLTESGDNYLSDAK